MVDSDVFITAKNLYYSFDICPGFWKSVVHHHRAGRVFSVDRARSELLATLDPHHDVRVREHHLGDIRGDEEPFRDLFLYPSDEILIGVTR
ncbi:MAG: DUF4411 family protein [Spirochaetaceae bacterium]|nr:DUF4411 family protein [Spirochaetaceae bacterium]